VATGTSKLRCLLNEKRLNMNVADAKFIFRIKIGVFFPALK